MGDIHMLTYSKDLGQFLIDLHNDKPQVLEIRGPAGSGKSLLANALANQVPVAQSVKLRPSNNLRDYLGYKVIVVRDAEHTPSAVEELVNEEFVRVMWKGQLETQIRNRISWIIEIQNDG